MDQGMKNFACTNCGNEVYFENILCLQCKRALGFLPSQRRMVALERAGDGTFRAIVDRRQPRPLLAYCANAANSACNWLTEVGVGNGLCEACVLNRTIPNLAYEGNLEAWRELEKAKKRLIYTLLRYDLPRDAARWGKGRLSFDFLQDATTGHLDGIITIDIAEADAVERERQRQYFGEPIRSLLGHLRHESGHFYWMVLIEAQGRLDAFRALFGDERQDYLGALARHHQEGPPKAWQKTFVSAYASCHPWEDWAETWALYLHMADAIDTAVAEGVKLRQSGQSLWLFRHRPFDAYSEGSYEDIMRRWVPLTLAMNSINRSLGNPDFYPFVIPAAAHRKLSFVHDVLRAGIA